MQFPTATPPPDTLWLLAPDSANDAIRAADTRDSLVARYGAANVIDADVDQGEGMLIPGTVLFPADSARRLEIQWGDSIAFARPEVVTAVGTGWMIAPGVGFGMTLQQLEQLNGRPFELAGFGGYTPGRITDWQGGRLAPLGVRGDDGYHRVVLQLQPAYPYPPGADTRSYSTTNVFPSSDAGMQLLNPRVVAIVVQPR